MSGIMGIVIGYRSNNNKTIKSIIIGMCCYVILSIVSLGLLSIISKLADFEIVTEGFPSLNTLKIMGISSILIYLFLNLLYYFIAKKLLNKGVNVD